MKNTITGLLSLIFLGFCQMLYAQNNASRFSGNLETTTNFFIRDERIGAANTPQYDHQLTGVDAWLQLNYSNWGFDIGVRFDLFNNSNLLNPQGSYNEQGIGRWFIRKKVNKLDISVGYLYDQIGSGIIFRAYEQRPLLIDNSLYGLRLNYDITDFLQVKALAGRQKQQFDLYESNIKAINFDAFFSGGGGDKGKSWSLAPGIGVLNRTLADNAMNVVVSTVNTYTVQDTFTPNYNTYAFSVYNTASYGDFSWYAEGAFKTEDALNDPFGEFRLDGGGTQVGDKFINETGTVLYSSVSYANKDNGIGITLEAKRTEFFSLRTRPDVLLNRGIINFLPPMNRVNTYRLLSRYSPAVQELGEMAYQADIRYSPTRKLSFNLNLSNIEDLNGQRLYREIYFETSYKYKRKWQILGGIQFLNYNQEIYEVKPDVPIVETITPYVDFLYKFSRKKAIRFEFQYMLTGDDEKAGFKQDYGDWAFGLVEFTLAPHWAFTLSDMYNINPGVNSPVDGEGGREAVHYPRADIFYTHKANRFSFSYVKQVEGIVCAGGVCRLEPAFSGFKLGINSTF
ncbi:MAG: DUF6029 family protein [Bacteroidota bacterium]